MTLQRLHKVMAAAGVGSRRACETLIAEGRVQVDGRVVDVPGTQVQPDEVEIRVDGERVNRPRLHYYLLNKPRGVICSARSRADTPKAVDYAPASARDVRLFTIGRLDVDSEGALLLTNDGDLCHMVTHPRFGIEKTYSVEVDGLPDAGTIEKMRRGAWLSEGRTSELDVRLVARKAKRAVLEVKLREGMKREIRRVCARHGHEVRRLKRLAIGPVRLGSLVAGHTRPLTPAEVAALRASADVVVRLGGTAPKARASARARGASPTAKRASTGSRPRVERGTDVSERAKPKRAAKPKRGAKPTDARKSSTRKSSTRGGKPGAKSPGARKSTTRGAKSGGAKSTSPRKSSTRGAKSTGARKSAPRGAKSTGARKSAPRGAKPGARKTTGGGARGGPKKGGGRSGR